MVTDETGRLFFRCLSLDLEVSTRDDRIFALAGVRPDIGKSVVFPAGGQGLSVALSQLDDLSGGADFLLGHNLIAFDLPRLQAANPSLRLLRLPAVDTLRLNPLAFPRNPYHRLVKHYQDGQLRRGKINDPELDARLTLEVFSDQQKDLRAAPASLCLARRSRCGHSDCPRDSRNVTKDWEGPFYRTTSFDDRFDAVGSFRINRVHGDTLVPVGWLGAPLRYPKNLRVANQLPGGRRARLKLCPVGPPGG